MESRPAEAARRSLHEDAKRMTAEQRLAEFLSHCQLMAQLANSEASTRLGTQYRRMRASAPGQSALLMAGVAQSLAGRGVRYAFIGAIGALVASVSVL
jgi:hypothetical protein